MVTAAAPGYSHATEPRAVANRSKFRAPEGADGQASNIMFDRRVVRGSTYAQPIDTPVRPPFCPPRAIDPNCYAQASKQARLTRAPLSLACVSFLSGCRTRCRSWSARSG